MKLNRTPGREIIILCPVSVFLFMILSRIAFPLLREKWFALIIELSKTQDFMPQSCGQAAEKAVEGDVL